MLIASICKDCIISDGDRHWLYEDDLGLRENKILCVYGYELDTENSFPPSECPRKNKHLKVLGFDVDEKKEPDIISKKKKRKRK